MLEVRELTKRFQHGGREVRAVNGISFAVKPGEVFGLLGPNGAGKTTTLRMILGLLRPDSGEAIVNGFRTSIDADDVKSQIGLVSANDGIYPWLTGREMIMFFADLFGVPPQESQQRLAGLIEIFRLGDFIDRRCSTYSTGQKQRVLFARGLIHDPAVMLLDEPTRGMDVVGTRRVFEYLDFLRKQQKVVIISTHRLDEAQRCCDRFGLLFQGELKHCGTLQELVAATGKSSLVEMFHQLLDSPMAQGVDFE